MAEQNWHNLKYLVQYFFTAYLRKRRKFPETLNTWPAVFFYPLSSLPMFEEKLENQVSYSIFERGINLPSYHDINLNSIKYVIDIIKASLND